MAARAGDRYYEQEMSENDTHSKPREQKPPSRRQVAALSNIRVLGDPVLREAAALVTDFNRELAKTASRMIRIMHDAPGVGLAATQIGYMRRLLVYDVDSGAIALVNPEIVEFSEETDVEYEGCLSVPEAHVPVERALHIRVRAQDTQGHSFEYEADDLEARVVQHELDHLDGILIVDRTTREARATVLRQLRETVAAGDL